MTSAVTEPVISTQLPEQAQERSARAADFHFSDKPRCVVCGQWISMQAALDGLAHHYFEPDNHFGPERSEWTCGRCAAKDDSNAT